MFGSQWEQIFQGNTIHPSAVIGPDVSMGMENYIGPFCIITGKTDIGFGNRFEAFCSIGLAPEHRDYWDSEYRGVQIRNNCVIREMVTIHSGTTHDTIIEDNVIMLRQSHAGHDTFIGRNSNISCSVLLGGHTIVEEGANLGLNCTVHQYSRIGAFSMCGMSTVVTKSSIILPGNCYIGAPARYLKENLIGLDRAGITQDQIIQMRKEFSFK